MTGPSPDPQHFLAVAKEYLGENNREEAIPYLRSALVSDPDNLEARLLLGESLVNVGKIETGLEHLEAVYAADAKLGRAAFADGLVAKARLLSESHREEEALELCRKAMDISPDHSPAYQLFISLQVRKADVALLRDDLESASESYRLAGDVNKADQVHTLFRWQKQADLEARARSLELDERWEEAIVMYGKLLSSAMERDIKESWETSLEHCREETELAKIFDDGLASFELEEWGDAQSYFIELINRRPDYHRGGHYVTALLDHAVRADTFDFVTPLPIFSPLKLAPTLITVENARRIVGLARWGLGKPCHVEYTLDDRYLAVSTSIGVFFFYKNKSEVARFFDADSAVVSLAVSPDSSQLATGFEDGTIWIWRAGDGSLNRKLRGHARKITALAFSPDSSRVVSGAEDGTVRLWNVSDGRILQVLQGQMRTVAGVDFSPDGTCIAVASGSNQIRIHNLESGELADSLESRLSLHRVDYSPDGNFLAAGTREGPVAIWQLLEKRNGRLDGLEHKTAVLRFSPDGRSLVAGDETGNLLAWDMKNPAEPKTLGHPRGRLYGLAFSRGGTSLAVSAADNRVQIWDLEQDQVLQILEGFSSGIQRIFAGTGGNFILSTMDDGSIRLWNLTDGRESGILAENIRPYLADISPEGEMLAAISINNELMVWRTNPYVMRLKIPLGEAISSLSFSKDGSRVALGTEAGGIQVWSPVSSELQYALEAHDGSVSRICYAPGGLRIASFGKDYTLKLWRASDGQLMQAVAGIDEDINQAVFSPDGIYLVCGTQDGAVMRWRASTTLVFEKKFQAHATAVQSLAHSPDGEILVTGFQDGSLRLWQISSETLLQTLSGHNEAVGALAFKHDGSLVFSGGADGVIRIWGAVGR